MQKSKASTSKINYRATRKLEMRKPFAFSLSYDLDLVVIQQGNDMEEENVSFSMMKKRQYSRIAFFVKITLLFILPHLNSLKNVIVSLFVIPMPYSVFLRLLIKILLLFI